MNKQPDISVIVPCFNAEKYLDLCLMSLKSQKNPDIEMILVDDGSNDSSGSILDHFAENEPRARVIHTINGGVSSARNQGLSLAKGKYIAFMDADDAWEENALSMLWNAAIRNGAQIVSAGHTLFDVEKNCRVPVELDRVPNQPSEIVREIIHMHRIYNNIWNKLYASELFSDGLRLDENVKIGEDALLNLQLYSKAVKIVYLEEKTYVYRVHTGSAMSSIKGYSEAHQPMLRSMSDILSSLGLKECYFRDYLMSSVWIDEKEKGILVCMKAFNKQIRPLVLKKVNRKAIPKQDAFLYQLVCMGLFPEYYIAQRVKDKVLHTKRGRRA